jgi:cell division transport system permease protein
MRRRRKTTAHRHGFQFVTLCISTTLVLVLLGLMVLSMLTAHNLSKWVKENLTVTVMLADSASDQEARQLCKRLSGRPFAKEILYVSKEQALKEQSAAMGTDPTEFLGVNPFVATLELQLNADYANGDSLKWIASELKRHSKVTDVTYQQDLMDKVNVNLHKVSLALLVLAVLMTFVSFTLINNSVRLSIYSRRFIIHTMKLVGASWRFIRAPFLRQTVVIGVLAAVLACAVLGAGLYAFYTYEPGMLTIVSYREIGITAAAVVFFGIAITLFCAYISVNRFLRMSAGELYKI